MKKEKDMFKDIIGYDDIKMTLTRLIDVLNNKEKYEKIGSTIPHGLFIYGDPGIGKTTFSNAILESVTNRKSYIIRKTKSDGSFLDYIEEVFEDFYINPRTEIKVNSKYLTKEDKDKLSIYLSKRGMSYLNYQLHRIEYKELKRS